MNIQAGALTMDIPKPDSKIQVAVVGLGYFSQFHLSAWEAHPDTQLVAVCDRDADRTTDVAKTYGVGGYSDVNVMLGAIDPQIVDIVAPPVAHAALLRAAFAEGRTIICQKPFCTSIIEAEVLIKEAAVAGSEIVVHENFRFQPWYRETKDLLDSGRLGQVYQARFALRPGDGRGPDAYLARQPAFQTMPRLLIHETGGHFIDLFRWMFGEIRSVYADLRRLNPVIAGEDAGLLIMTHDGGVRSVFDGNRLADQGASDPRRTMGQMEIDAEGGQVRLDGDGRLWLRDFGAQCELEVPVTRPVDLTRFGGGCVAALIDHVVQARASGARPENLATEYLQVMRVIDAAYRSAETGQRIMLEA